MNSMISSSILQPKGLHWCLCIQYEPRRRFYKIHIKLRTNVTQHGPNVNRLFVRTKNDNNLYFDRLTCSDVKLSFIQGPVILPIDNRCGENQGNSRIE